MKNKKKKKNVDPLIQEIRYMRDSIVAMLWVNAALAIQLRWAIPEEVTIPPFDEAAGEAWNLMRQAVKLSHGGLRTPS